MIHVLNRMLYILLSVLLLSGCALPADQPPAVASVTLTDSVHDQTMVALRSLTNFPAQATQFYASVKVLHPRKGTTLKARWYYEGKLVDEADVTFDTEGDRHVAFHLISDRQQPFPAGPYRVQVLLDDRLDREIDFRVE